MTYFETDMPVTNAYTESINRLAKDKNREGRGYSFEVMRARMIYTTKHKKKAPTAKVSPFYKKTIGYGLPDFAERSEEHTSELQSLMRISYAVFCLKNTNTT